MANIKSFIKKSILHIAKALGVLRFFSYLNRNKVRILCFHSSSILDEHQFWPGVFLSNHKLQELLTFFKNSHYQVISLEEAKQHLRGEINIKYPVVFTVDDGWYSSTKYLIPEFIKYHYPSTLYVTTYYVNHQIPILNVILQYMFWKTKCAELNFMWDKKPYHFVLQENDNIHCIKTIESFLKKNSDEEKIQCITIIGHALNIDIDALINSRCFQLASTDELQEINQSLLVNLQLHSHTHRMPKDFESLEKEITRNKACLKAYKKDIEQADFCYPSGVWRRQQCRDLKRLNIDSATTLERGLNAPGSDLLLLKRIIVSDTKSLLELEANLSGFL